MYWDEGAHARPYFQARYGEYQASVDFHGEVVVGWLPSRALGFVSEWALPHTDSYRPTGTVHETVSPFSRSSRWPSMISMDPLVDVVAVEVIGDHRLRLSFEDGTVGDVAFVDREWHGVFEPLADPAFFAQVRVDPEAGTIVWPNGVDMAPEPLYAQSRLHRVAERSARG